MRLESTELKATDRRSRRDILIRGRYRTVKEVKIAR